MIGPLENSHPKEDLPDLSRVSELISRYGGVRIDSIPATGKLVDVFVQTGPQSVESRGTYVFQQGVPVRDICTQGSMQLGRRVLLSIRPDTDRATHSQQNFERSLKRDFDSDAALGTEVPGNLPGRSALPDL